MAELRTEEEQIQAIKDWWKENGNALLIALAAAVVLVFGWKGYQNSVVESKTEASLMYERLLAAAMSPNDSDSESSGMGFLAGEIKENHGDTEYGIYAAMFLARDAVEKGELEKALGELNWVKENTEDTRLHDIANGRIARILSQQDKFDEALALLEPNESEFSAQFLEIEGDIKLRQGDQAAAIDAYSKAYSQVKDSPQFQPLLAVKLANLGVNTENL